MNRLKGYWVVRCGLVPGEPMKQYTKEWAYNEAGFEEDGKHKGEINYQTSYDKLRRDALGYFEQMSNPSIMNWATIEFMWL